jgi:hopanoid biosynthesis associated RND transporter like protein HpnN
MPEGDPRRSPLSLTGRLLQRVVRVCCARPVLTVVVGVVFAVLGGGYAWQALTLQTSKFHLLPVNQRYATLYKSYSEDFSHLEDIVVAVQSPTVALSKAYAARLAGALRDGSLATARISYRLDRDHFDERAMLYLPVETLRDLLDTLAGQEDVLADFAATPTLDRLVASINQGVGAGFLPSVFGPGSEAEVNAAPARLLRELLTRMSERLDGRPYRSPWVALFRTPVVTPTDDHYFLSPDGRLLYVVIALADVPRTFATERQAVADIRHAIARLRPQFPAVEAGVTGVPALFTDEMSVAARDSNIASALAFVLTLGLLLIAFRRLVTSCALLAVLAVSLGWSFGLVTVLVGQLTSFSVMFVSVVIGIGIDYGIYFLFRYQEERGLGRPLTDALEGTAARSGPGMLLGALTAAATFYILTIAEFPGIREFGFISGTAILLAFLAMITVFPATLVLIDGRRKLPRGVRMADQPGARPPLLDVPALEWLIRHPKPILFVVTIVTGVSLWAAPRVGFDYDLLNLQGAGSESVVWERKIAAAAGRSGFAALATASSLEELEAKRDAFRRLPSVSDVQSVLSVLPDRQAEKLAILERVAAITDSIRVGGARALDVDALTAALETLERRLALANATSRGDGRLALANATSRGDGPRAEVIAIAGETSALIARLKTRHGSVVDAALTDFQARLASDFTESWQRLQRAARPAPVTLSDLPEELRRNFIGTSGRLLLQVYSRLDVWERAGQTRFVEELRTVDPDVTGQPVVAYESMHLVERACREGLAYAFVLVAGIAALMIRRGRETTLALVPLVLGTLWTVALMELCGLRFNLVNVWALPLIVGSAAEYGVNIVLRALESRMHGGPRLARSTVMGVVFNGLTTIAGFGSLLVAHHRGVWSLGLLLAIGTTMTLAASLVVLPTLMHLAHKRLPAVEADPRRAAVAVASVAGEAIWRGAAWCARVGPRSKGTKVQ